MSICRTSIAEFYNEADADKFVAEHVTNFDSMFPEAEQTINSRVSPTTYISSTVYANMEDIEKTNDGARKTFLDKHQDRMQSISTHVGKVTLSK